MRLNSYLAKAGVTSRRGADELIKAGRVKVNGKTGQLNDQVSEADGIEVDNRLIKLQQYRIILLNKPAGYITTTKDPQRRRKVTDLVKVPQRVVPVGRLDYDTSGVLLLTNDGGLAHRLTHPSYKVEKVYEADVQGEINGEKLKRLREGIKLEDGKTAPSKAGQLSGSRIKLVIHEGRKHQVKRMLAAVGLEVTGLHRSRYAGLTLEGLRPGEWRELTKTEVQKLRDLVYS